MATMSKSNWNIECLSILLAPSENVRQHKDDNQPPLHEVSVPHQRSRSSSVSSAATARPGTPGGSSTDDPRARTMSGTTLCDYSSIGDLSRPVSSASTAAKRSNSVPLMPTPGLLPGATGLLIGCHRNSGGTDSLTTQMNANSNGPSSSDDNGQLNSLRVDVEKVAPSIKDGERVSAPFSAPARGAQETRGWWRYIFG
ncbi:hypothetical protein BD410DRAFT_128893 [Rickenella mellea]|uniref:Uncharacterized protein n=1 Tax=Rickenella mellea TaxID=50990 RepID=A0A4Y7QA12_9AGAM|nr:hypothetical protein BD410DRAFT_128893 [Rickenella mellea]